MQFTPKTEQELETDGLCPEGIYSYQVIKSQDRPNKAQTNIYTAITLKVWDNEGGEHLVFTNMALTKLLKHFCDVNDMQSAYQSGNIPQEEFMYKAGGKVIIGIEKEKPSPDGGMYKAKNIVKDYIAEPKGSSLNPIKSEKKESDFHDDEIPF